MLGEFFDTTKSVEHLRRRDLAYFNVKLMQEAEPKQN